MRGNNVLKDIFIVLILVLIPISLIVKLWEIIVTYWMIITAVLFFAVGGLFLFFYFKEYSWKLVMNKLRSFLKKSKVTDNSLDSLVAQRSAFFMISGVVLQLMALYLGYRFFNK